MNTHIAYYPGRTRFSPDAFGHQLYDLVSHCPDHAKKDHCPLLFLCIGSDRVSGDCLGPLVGYKLEQNRDSLPDCFQVCGSLSHPVHAVNLRQQLRELRRREGLTIAIDASIGSRKTLGTLCISPDALYPGEGVSKNLPPVGQISITGVTAYEENPVPFHQQNVPLSFVMEMADRIYQGLIIFLKLYTA